MRKFDLKCYHFYVARRPVTDNIYISNINPDREHYSELCIMVFKSKQHKPPYKVYCVLLTIEHVSYATSSGIYYCEVPKYQYCKNSSDPANLNISLSHISYKQIGNIISHHTVKIPEVVIKTIVIMTVK